ncbi:MULTISPECIES: Ig-like domain-containing protein [unclassified Burkholderia]|uniref:Ig-like domain-containing protein n=1 Tax=unclassified Burkholderia TaxID=2613784 RepID=UPI0014211E49|nr:MULTISPECIES: Ig-like domain-containing protein [unclassified Burkholderia]NIE61140.1 hypothetical protein [Burkholderia sp. Ap-955]NIF13242.1 hypothetical protein [Burkholderia sp. Ax-1735]NIG07030.1 hypothetical protein [Burkholderia sp. Tr-849]
MAEQKATTRPSRPTIDAVTDNVPPHTGVIENGGLTNDPKPTVSGRGDPGSTIHLLVDGVEVGTVIVGADGAWSFALTQPLHDGEYRLTARASNDVGMSVPSTSYGIQVDVTPPLQPEIEAATPGAQPTLSGHAEAYSTVAVYDGTTLLGTTKTDIDGKWTFQVTSPLSSGTHALTVTAMDEAGNTSARSAGFDLTVGPVAPPVPLAKAVLDDMGRDSGKFNFDRLTNDGTAGRLLSGHLTVALAAGEKVQVSTDGGRTWMDALVKSDGTWVAIDSNAHTGNWTIQTRVVNGAGETGELSSTDVALKTSVLPPTSVDVVGNTIVVKFAGSQVQAGSELSVMIGKQFFLHTLTPEEIAAGTVTFARPDNAAGTPAVAIVDLAGNVSQYRTAPSSFEFSENFNTGPTGGLFDGQVIDLKYFKLTGLRELGGYYWAQGIYKGNEFAMEPGFTLSEPSSSMALGITGKVKLDLNDGITATRFSCDVGDLTTTENLVLTFLDSAGRVIYTSPGISPSRGMHQHVTYDMPSGLSFKSIVFEQTGNVPANKLLIWVDNLVFSGKAASQLIDPPTLQEVAGDAAYYGGNADTVFTVGNVSYFSQSGTGVHGGAGIDTLKLTGANQFLDVTKLNSSMTEKITGIEIIDITGSGDNTLKLSMKDVLNLGHENLFRADGHTQLMVNGNAGDRVQLSGMDGLDGGNWTSQGMVAINGQAYALYENAALHVELLVQSSVATQLI